MDILLDTHILIWTVLDSKHLTQKARKIITKEDTNVYYSKVSILEAELKKLSKPGQIDIGGTELLSECRKSDMNFLDLSFEHIEELKNIELTEYNKDPFDRLLMAQAKCEGMTLLTCDEKIIKRALPFVISC